MKVKWNKEGKIHEANGNKEVKRERWNCVDDDGNGLTFCLIRPSMNISTKSNIDFGSLSLSLPPSLYANNIPPLHTASSRFHFFLSFFFV
jgi:hypothetical protein